MNKELEKLNDKEQARFHVMAMPNSRAFIVTPDKAQDFKNTKSNPEVVKRNEELVQKLRINNLTQSERSKKKIRKPNITAAKL